VLSSIGNAPIRSPMKVDRPQLFWKNYVAGYRADLLFVIHSVTVADLPFVIEHSSEKRPTAHLVNWHLLASVF
jgi:hypothetical protein